MGTVYRGRSAGSALTSSSWGWGARKGRRRREFSLKIHQAIFFFVFLVVLLSHKPPRRCGLLLFLGRCPLGHGRWRRGKRRPPPRRAQPLSPRVCPRSLQTRRCRGPGAPGGSFSPSPPTASTWAPRPVLEQRLPPQKELPKAGLRGAHWGSEGRALPALISTGKAGRGDALGEKGDLPSWHTRIFFYFPPRRLGNPPRRAGERQPASPSQPAPFEEAPPQPPLFSAPPAAFML